MNNFLVNHAYTNVWCDPEQDFQHIFEPQRLTDPRGVLGSCTILWRTIQLPTPTDRYHVYQIGQVNPAAIGLIATMGAWSKLSTVMMQKLVFMQVYTTQGLMFPLAECYLMFTRDRNLVLAVKEQPTIAPLATTALYFRFYSNAYFGSQRSAGSVSDITTYFSRFTDVITGLQFQNLYHTYQVKSGFCALFLNGQYVNDAVPMSLNVGDVLEFVHDSSVKKVVDFNVVDLQGFDSIKDLKRKYLLHYAGPQAGDVSIDYRDDCDLYLFKKTPDLTGTVYQGVIFHKNQDDAFRQLTHRDYSVCIPYISAYLLDQPTWGALSELTLRLVIRNAGFDRPLVYDSHQIKELYKLQDADIVNAFLGVNSTVDVWRAPALEASEYVSIMDAEVSGITLPLVEAAYGYNAMARLIGDSPALIQAPVASIVLPPGLQANATMYEYDVNGVLLGYYPHVLGIEYIPVYPGAQLIEGIVGNGSSLLPQVMGQPSTPIQVGFSYRFYIAPIAGGKVVTTAWQDVTGDATKYQIVNGTAVWLVDLNAYQVCVKSDAGFLTYELPMSPANGLLQFSVTAEVNYPNGNVVEPLTIPVGQLDLWLNGYALIENLDYYVTWPQVVIVNKAYLVAGVSQVITVRGTGFSNSDLSRTVAEETSFLKWGVLSHNDRFNLRDDKPIRIIGAGRTFHRSQVVFAENQISATLPAVPNGSPYAVTDVVVPLRGFVDQDTYALRTPALAVDTEISNYLTLKLPDTTPTTVDIIADKYSVYSPFSSTIIHDLVNGTLLMANFQGQYSDKDVYDFLSNYRYLLAYDPTQRGVDLTHVAVHPHNLTTTVVLTIYQYNFLKRAVHVFLNDAVDLSRFLAIDPNRVQ